MMIVTVMMEVEEEVKEVKEVKEVMEMMEVMEVKEGQVEIQVEGEEISHRLPKHQEPRKKKKK